MTVNEIAKSLESWAPLAYQESYDNSGLLVGSPDMTIKGVLISLDCTEAVVDDAISKGCNMIVSHHPLIFGSLKRLTGANHVERTVIKALKNDIALYAIHTNLDNVHNGVNRRIAERLELTGTSILAPKKGLLKKLVVFCPHDNVENLRQSIFEAGAGAIGDYDECSFNLKGEGTFRGAEGSDPFVGEPGKQHSEPETRVEVIFQSPKEKAILAAMIDAHPYEEVAYDIYQLDNFDQTKGAGMIGKLSVPMEEEAFLRRLKDRMNTGCVRHTPLRNKNIETVAVCGGSGSFLLGTAKGAGADVFITGDFKYHDFFHAEGDIIIADIGHYESEQFTIDLLLEYLCEKFSDISVHATTVNTNPIQYL